MKFEEIIKTCPFCKMRGVHKRSMVTLFGEEVDGFMKHLTGEFIQNALPNTSPAVREFVRMTNNLNAESYCSDHMKELFGKTDERIRDFTDAAMQVSEYLDINSYDENAVGSKEEYFQLQAELVELAEQYRKNECDFFFLAERKDRVPSDVEIVFSTEHLVLRRRENFAEEASKKEAAKYVKLGMILTKGANKNNPLTLEQMVERQAGHSDDEVNAEDDPSRK